MPGNGKFVIETNVTDGGLPENILVFPCIYVLHTLHSDVFFYHELYIISAKDSIVKNST